MHNALAAYKGENDDILHIKVAFKLNTVVNVYNVDEDMTEQIIRLNPVRWKVNTPTLFSHVF